MMGDTSGRSGGTVEAFELLASQRRLHTLLCLREMRAPMDVRELAVNVAVRECGGAPDEIPERVIERVQQSLYHAHLPKLHESGVVSYSRAQGAVRLADDIEEVESVISAVFNE